MRKYKDVITKRINILECNRCKKKVKEDDYIEWQEFFMVDLIGGYGSIWGDQERIGIDLCQQCAYKLLKDYANKI